MSYATITYDVAPAGVATLALDAPETRNALSDELLGELLDALRSARDDPAVQARRLLAGPDEARQGRDVPPA